jgi:hypothetical protein
VFISKQSDLEFHPRPIPAAAFYSTLFTIFGWDLERKYRITGSLYEQDNELAYVFDVIDSEVFIKQQAIPPEERDSGRISIFMRGHLLHWQNKVRKIGNC